MLSDQSKGFVGMIISLDITISLSVVFSMAFSFLSTSLKEGERVDKSSKFYSYVCHSSSWRKNTKKYFNLWILHNFFIISKTGNSLANYVMLRKQNAQFLAGKQIFFLFLEQWQREKAFSYLLALFNCRQEKFKEKGLQPPFLSLLLTSSFKQYFFFFFNYLFIYLFIYGCVGSSFLCEGFL